VFGLARGALIIFVLVGLAGHTELPQEPWWREARLAGAVVGAVQQSKSVLPPALSSWLPDWDGICVHYRKIEMCGIVGAAATGPVNQVIYDSLWRPVARRPPRPACLRIFDLARSVLRHVQGVLAGARCLPGPEYPRAAGQLGLGPGARSEGGLRGPR